jgi:NRPS condensation-like uncharacterized protein
MTDKPKYVKATFLLPEDIVEDVKKIAREKGWTENDVVVSAVATLKFFEEQERKGAKILLEESDRTYQRVRMR